MQNKAFNLLDILQDKIAASRVQPAELESAVG